VDAFGGLLERELAGGVVEVVQKLDLSQRQLQRADRFEQVRVAVLVEVDDERVEVGGEVGGRRGARGSGPLPRSYLHACKYCALGRVARRGCISGGSPLGLQELV
jgi:hypothetical protein